MRLPCRRKPISRRQSQGRGECRCKNRRLAQLLLKVVPLKGGRLQLRVYCRPRASVAVLCEASLCTGAAVRESRRRRPHRESPLRAAAALWPANWVGSARQRSNACGGAVDRAIIGLGNAWSAPGSLGQLCNLAANPGETKSVSFDQPQIVKELIRIP